MTVLEANAPKRYTPCRFQNPDEIAHALAEVHVELVLIHPFPDGNGRIARLLSTLMALQAGIDRNYAPMRAIFAQIISATPAAGR
jgi:cell filamentation protein